jgi:cell division protein FtsL
MLEDIRKEYVLGNKQQAVASTTHSLHFHCTQLFLFISIIIAAAAVVLFNFKRNLLRNNKIFIREICRKQNFEVLACCF